MTYPPNPTTSDTITTDEIASLTKDPDAAMKALKAQTPTMDTRQPEGGITPAEIAAISKDPTGAANNLKGNASYTALDYIKAGFNQSRDDIRNATVWNGAMVGLISDEQASQQTEPNFVARQRQQGLKDYETLHPWAIETAVKEIVGMAPYLVQSAEDTIPFTLGGTAVGAATGAVSGETAGVAFTPLTGGTSLIAGPAAGALWGAGTGAAAGTRTGISLSAARIAGGSMFGKLIREGVPRDKAMAAALASGAASGLIQGAAWNRIGAVTTKALIAEKEAIQKSAAAIIGKLALEWGLQIGAADLQESANIAVESLVGHVGLHKPPDLKEIIERMAKATTQGATTGALVPIAHGVGTVAGKVKRGPISEAAAHAKDAMTQESGEFKTADEIKLVEMKAELAVMKAEEKISNIQGKIEKAKQENTGVKVLNKELEVARQELAVAQQNMPLRMLTPVADIAKQIKTIKGQVEKTVSVAEANDNYKAAEVKIAQLEDSWSTAVLGNDEAATAAIAGDLKLARQELRQAAKQRKASKYNAAVEQIDHIIETAKSKFVIETDEPIEKEIKRNQTIVTDLIKHSPLPKQLQADFISAVKATQTTAQLIKVVDGYTVKKRDGTPGERVKGLREKIKSLVNAEDITAANTYLAKVIKSLDPIASKSKRPKGKFDLPVAKVLDKYKEWAVSPKSAEAWIRESRQKKLEAETKMDEAVEKGAMPLPDDLSRDIYDIAANDSLIDHSDPVEVIALGNKIADIAFTGKQRRMDAKLAERQILEQFEQDVFDDIQGEEKYHVDVNEKFPEDKGALGKFGRIGGQSLMTWPVLVGHLTQHAAKPKSLDRLNVTSELLTAAQAVKEQFQKADKAMIGGDKKLFAEAVRMVHENKQITFGKYVNQDGELQTYRATEWEVVQDIMDMQNATADLQGETPKMLDGMRDGDKLTFRNNDLNKRDILAGETSFEELLEDVQAKHPYLRTLADNIMEYLNSDDQYDRINKPHEDEYAISILRQKNYTGMRRRRDINYGEEGSYRDTLINNSFARTSPSLVPSSTIDAVKSSKGYVRVNAYDNLSRNIQAVENWRELRNAEKRLRFVFRSSRVREVIKRKYGSDTLQIIDNMYGGMLGSSGIQHVQRNKLIASVRARVGAAYTYGKPLNALKQISSVTLVVNEIPVVDFMQYMTEATQHPRKVYELFKDTPLWNTRYDHYATELAEKREQQGIFGSKLSPKIIETTGMFLTAGDKVSVLSGGYAVYKSKMKQPGMTHEKALMAAQIVVNNTQSSALGDQITNWERGGDVNKGVVMFGKQPLQAGGAYVLALRRFIANPEVKENQNALARAILANAVASMIFTGVDAALVLGWKALWGGLTDKDLVEQSYRLLRSQLPAQGVPFISDGLNYVATEIMTNTSRHAVKAGVLPDAFNINDRGFAPSTLQTSLPTALYKLFVDVDEIANKLAFSEDIKPEDIFKALVDYGQAAPLLPTTWVSGAMPILPVIKGVRPAFVQPKGESHEAH